MCERVHHLRGLLEAVGVHAAVPRERLQHDLRDVADTALLAGGDTHAQVLLDGVVYQDSKLCVVTLVAPVLGTLEERLHIGAAKLQLVDRHEQGVRRRQPGYAARAPLASARARDLLLPRTHLPPTARRSPAAVRVGMWASPQQPLVLADDSIEAVVDLTGADLHGKVGITERPVSSSSSADSSTKPCNRWIVAHLPCGKYSGLSSAYRSRYVSQATVSSCVQA